MYSISVPMVRLKARMPLMSLEFTSQISHLVTKSPLDMFEPLQQLLNLPLHKLSGKWTLGPWSTEADEACPTSPLRFGPTFPGACALRSQEGRQASAFHFGSATRKPDGLVPPAGALPDKPLQAWLPSPSVPAGTTGEVRGITRTGSARSPPSSP